MKPSDILKKAITAVEKGTEKHGDTMRSFELISTMWGTYIAHVMAQRKNVSLTPFDVANMMMLVKLARSVYGHSEDNQVDAAGYAAIAAMLDAGKWDRLESELEREMTNATAKAV